VEGDEEAGDEEGPEAIVPTDLILEKALEVLDAPAEEKAAA
jgi:hypothetical protein